VSAQVGFKSSIRWKDLDVASQRRRCQAKN
jgi:hypothetical protein